MVNILQAAIFNNTLAETDSPAYAVQAQLTTLLRLAYYAWLPPFDVESNVTTASFSSVLAPVSKRGFWAVMGLVVAHIGITVIVVILFLARTKFSFLGNPWTAFAQVAKAEDCQALLEDESLLAGAAIAKRPENSGKSKTRYRIQETEAEGTVTLVPVEQPR
jgi:hypothetical protein